MAHCPHHKQLEKPACTIQKKGCCENRTIHLQSDVDQVNAVEDFALNSSLQQFVVAFVAAFLSPVPSENLAPNFQTYRPPIVARDIPVLYQSFLL